MKISNTLIRIDMSEHPTISPKATQKDASARKLIRELFELASSARKANQTAPSALQQSAVLLLIYAYADRGGDTPITASDITNLTGLDPASVNKYILGLENFDLIERKRHANMGKTLSLSVKKNNPYLNIVRRYVTATKGIFLK